MSFVMEWRAGPQALRPGLGVPSITNWMILVMLLGFGFGETLEAATPQAEYQEVGTRVEGFQRSGPNWPVFTGSLSVLLVFAMAWMQARHRQRVERSNVELRRSEEEARQALEDLAESEKKFRLLFETSSDAILLQDAQTQMIVDCNEQTVKMRGCASKAEILKMHPAALSPEVQADGSTSVEKAARLARLALERGCQEFEWLGRRANGDLFEIEARVSPMQMDDRTLLVTVCRDITDRKRVEDQIREWNQTLERRIAERTAELTASEARLRILVEHAPEAIVVFDADTGKFVMVNENAVRLYGRSREELLGMGPEDVSPEWQMDGQASRALAAAKVQEALAGETPVFEWTHCNAAGQEVPCEVRLVLLPAEGRHLIRGSIADTSERRRRELIQNATFKISEAAHTTRDLHSLYCQIHSIIKGLMPAENFYIALYDSVSELISFPYHVDEMSEPPQPRKLTTGLTGYVLRSGQALLVDRSTAARKRRIGDAVVLEGLGDIPYVESGHPSAIWLGVPLVVQGKAIGVMAVQDYQNEGAYGEEEKKILIFVASQTALAIERKRAEQALRESEQKHRALFEATSQGVLLHDERSIFEVNQAAVRLLGYSCEGEILGKHPAELSAPIQPGGHRAEDLARSHIESALKNGTARFDWVTRWPDGRDFPIEVFLSAIQVNGRQVIQAVILDISERKRVENELQRALAREKELGQLKSNFVSMVSHEFRTPLGIIMSSAEILESYLDQLNVEERREHLRSIHKNSRRMADLMEEVLLLGQVEAGKMQFKPSALDLRGICRRLVDEVLSATHPQTLILLTLSETLPEEVEMDERLLRHIFLNLLSNAVKYSAAGSPVHFDIDFEEGIVLGRIEDTGIGIPESDLDWLFSPFHRGRNVKDIPGTGLGLTIVKRCVELHRGSIQVESSLAGGTTVTVRLPSSASRASVVRRQGHV